MYQKNAFCYCSMGNVYYGFFELNKVIVNAPTSVYSLTPCPKSGFTRNLNGN